MSPHDHVSEVLEKGDELARRNEPTGALVQYDRALTLDRGNTSALERKVFVLMGQGRRVEALRCQEQLVALDPCNPVHRVDQANLALMVGDNDAAIAALTEAVRLAPSDPRILQRLGDAYRTSGDADQAFVRYNHALTAAPQDGDLWAAIADALIDAGRADEAVATLVHAAQLVPRFSDVDWNLRADHFYSLHDYEHAAQLYRRAIEVRPNVESWRGLGLAAQATENLAEALRCYEEALKLEPDKPDLLRLLNDRGFVLIGLQRMPEAQKCFQRLVELDPDWLAGWLNLGYTHMAMDQWAEAHEAYIHATRLAPDQADCWIRLGACEVQFGEGDTDLRKALTRFERAAELDDRSLAAWAYGGWVLAQLRDYDQAMMRLDRAIDIDASNVFSWRAKAWLLLEQGDVAAAEHCVDEMMDAGADRADALREKGVFLTDGLGRDEEALEVLLKADRLRPDDEGIRATIAETLLKIGRYAEARMNAEQVLGQACKDRIRCVMLFVVWASHVLEDGASGVRASAFAEFIMHLRDRCAGRPGWKLNWKYRGLRRVIRDGTASVESQFLLSLAMDLQEGKLQTGDISFFGDLQLTSTG